MHTIKRSFSILLFAAFIYSFLFVFIPGCHNISRNNTHPEIAEESIERGKSLSAVYCQSCHSLPDPSLADTHTWEKGILPNMGPKLGIFKFENKAYPYFKYDFNLSHDFYPLKPLLKPDEWKSIMDYYMATSPDSVNAAANDQPIGEGLPGFSAIVPAFTYPSPAVSLVKINEQNPDHDIIVSDAIKHTIYRFNKQLQPIDSFDSKGPVVDIEIEKDNWLACNIGVLNPNNGKFGSGEYLHMNAAGKLQADSAILFKNLARPVQLTAADLNNDQKTDYVVCEFGFLTGALSWMENLGNGKFDRHVLRPLPGAVKAYVQDYNHDGLPDLWVLFAQGEEGIFLFTNKGHGQFEQKEVLRFPPIYGSSYFELDDFNKDGEPDIVYTCGDNADYSTILKPYHGTYIFINDGKNNFKQQYFFHINGCYKAIARDYDGDGDLDIATISFFSDYTRRPQESFVYLQNNGNFSFKPFTTKEAQSGRWLTMDAGDIDGDGKIDLILGNFSIGPVMIKSKVDWKSGPPFIILKNTTK